MSKISKAERQVNLTMALLASKRFLSREEIFTNVHGYEGNGEAMERMFERDKVDLRELGIEIEVGSNDPFFEDELGYRIDPHKYSLQLPALSASQLRYLSLALETWREAALSPIAARAKIKFQSLGIDFQDVEFSENLLTEPAVAADLALALTAISERRELIFKYWLGDLLERHIYPHRVFSVGGDWYLAGFDLARQSYRNFKFTRLTQLTSGAAPDQYQPEIFEDHALQNPVLAATNAAAKLMVRVGKVEALSQYGHRTEMGSDWELLEIDQISVDFLREMALRYLEDIVILEPADLRAEVLAVIN